MLPIILSIICYITPPSDPVPWMVSGEHDAVQEIVAEVKAMPSARVVAMARDGETAFARFELPPDIASGELDELNSDARQKGLIASSPAIWDMCSGHDLGESGANVPGLTIGLLGDEDAVGTVEQQIPWAKTFPFQLQDGEEGVAFLPGSADRAAFDAFVQAASNGLPNGVDVVMVEPALE